MFKNEKIKIKKINKKAGRGLGIFAKTEEPSGKRKTIPTYTRVYIFNVGPRTKGSQWAMGGERESQERQWIMVSFSPAPMDATLCPKVKRLKIKCK